MSNVGDLKLLPVWVSPRHLASTALHIMRGHRLKTLAVVDGSELVGVLEIEDLPSAAEVATAGDLMRPLTALFQAGSNVRDVARVFAEDDLNAAAVVENESFRGMLTPTMLLRELGRSYDPLTKLSWSDQLRDWGVEHLKHSEEVTIIFIDLNRFGLYNKKYGHLVGDKVIAKVADHLAAQVDPSLDVLVRYGGDEFAIGTVRDRDETEAFAELLSKRFDGNISGAEEPASFTTGVFGGRRTKERENVHYAATIDNLINIASRNCTANKKKERGDPPDDKPAKTQYGVLGIYSDDDEKAGIITVIVGGGGTVYSGAASRTGKSVVDAIAEATAKAAGRVLKDTRLKVVAIDLLEEANEQIVTITGERGEGEGSVPVSAAKRVSGELSTAVAEAALEAFLG